MGNLSAHAGNLLPHVFGTIPPALSDNTCMEHQLLYNKYMTMPWVCSQLCDQGQAALHCQVSWHNRAAWPGCSRSQKQTACKDCTDTLPAGIWSRAITKSEQVIPCACSWRLLSWAGLQPTCSDAMSENQVHLTRGAGTVIWGADRRACPLCSPVHYGQTA